MDQPGWSKSVSALVIGREEADLDLEGNLLVGGEDPEEKAVTPLLCVAGVALSDQCLNLAVALGYVVDGDHD